MKSSNGPVIHWCYHFLYHSEAASMIEQWNDLLMFVTMPAIWQCLACLGHISPGDCLFSVYKLWHCFFLIQYSLVQESRVCVLPPAASQWPWASFCLSKETPSPFVKWGQQLKMTWNVFLLSLRAWLWNLVLFCDLLFSYPAFSSYQRKSSSSHIHFHINNIYKAWFIQYVPYFAPECI